MGLPGDLVGVAGAVSLSVEGVTREWLPELLALSFLEKRLASMMERVASVRRNTDQRHRPQRPTANADAMGRYRSS